MSGSAAQRRIGRGRTRSPSRGAAAVLAAGGGAVLALATLSMLRQLVSAYPVATVLLLAGILIVACLIGFLRYRLRQRRPATQTLGELLMLSPRQFEGAVGDLLRRLGFADVQRVGGAGDLTVDLRCRDRQGRCVVVQCKRYAPGARIGSPAMQAFIGMLVVRHQAAYGIFVTTAQFTAPARQLAGQHRVTAIDGGRLAQLLTEAERGGVGQPRLIPPGVPESSRLAMFARRLGR